MGKIKNIKKQFEEEDHVIIYDHFKDTCNASCNRKPSNQWTWLYCLVKVFPKSHHKNK